MGLFKDVISTQANNMFGKEFEEFKKELNDAKQQIKDEADAAGVTEKINKAKAAINSGREKLNEKTSSKSEKITANDIMEKLPDNIVVMPVNNPQMQTQQPAQPQQSEFDNLNNQLKQIEKLKDLVDMGVLTQAEFEIKKKEVLGI